MVPPKRDPEVVNRFLKKGRLDGRQATTICFLGRES